MSDNLENKSVEFSQEEVDSYILQLEQTWVIDPKKLAQVLRYLRNQRNESTESSAKEEVEDDTSKEIVSAITANESLDLGKEAFIRSDFENWAVEYIEKQILDKNNSLTKRCVGRDVLLKKIKGLHSVELSPVKWYFRYYWESWIEIDFTTYESYSNWLTIKKIWTDNTANIFWQTPSQALKTLLQLDHILAECRNYSSTRLKDPFRLYTNWFLEKQLVIFEIKDKSLRKSLGAKKKKRDVTKLIGYDSYNSDNAKELVEYLNNIRKIVEPSTAVTKGNWTSDKLDFV